ncbi:MULTISPECIES: UbiX family flavin prenyltransferase [Ramlibacter]|uniref:Flavin prenyltransferase UbiX n=1 Tax=Ramlibacter pinisoli TaxID=2682844 RepID=A0A6N8IQW7_9BURK|nr:MULTISPECIES: UbiX family flavin prenyltransferase [Ramlibacter]MBA2963276.1 UbiX family flavin prenyltransferase [Ramlibacter sp. CGMCC 1.13660]MVQ28243.1 UbiX family flavin prenyltransferase [Ramlibacter pinisoli]
MSARMVVGITGATGAVYGVRLLARLRELGVETHLVVSRSGWLTLQQEMGLARSTVQALADVHYDINDVGAAIASGSFRHGGMVVAPCSMRTLAAVAHGFNDNLITRAADVTLKERRTLVLMARETPLTLAHLRNMTNATEMGARIMPPVPAFYALPSSIDEMVDHTVWRVLDQFGITAEGSYDRWSGTGKAAGTGRAPADD